jgi:tetratricopeptide (TPR) repeat protein
VAAFGGVLRNGFVYDDLLIIHGNPFFTAQRDWLALFTKDYFVHSIQGSYRPMVTLTYMIDGALWGSGPFGYHLTNLLLHVGNVLLIFAVVRKAAAGMTNDEIPNHERSPEIQNPKGLPDAATRVAVIAAALFAVHPAFTEVVSFPNYREDLLVLFWSLAAIRTLQYSIAPSLHHSTPTLLLSAFFLFLALLSKESGLGLVLFFGLCVWLCARRLSPLSSLLSPLIPFVIVTLVYLALRFGVYRAGNELKPSFIGDSFFTNVATMCGVVLSYARAILWPMHLRADYLVSPVSGVGWVMSVGGFVVLVGGWLWVLKRGFDAERHDHSWLPVLALGWFLCFLLPVMNLHPIAHPKAERYLYIPCVGLFVLVGLAIVRLRDRLRSQGLQAVFTGALGLSLACFIALSQARVVECANSLRLWKSAVRCEPDSAIVRSNLGVAYQEQGNLREALLHFERSMDLHPSPRAELNMARVKADIQGTQAESIAVYEKTLGDLPEGSRDLPFMHHGLAIQLRKAGRLEEATAAHQKAIKLKSDSDKFHLHYGITLQEAGQFIAAQQQYEKALALFPDRAQTHYRVGTLREAESGGINAVRLMKKKLKEAAAAYQRALMLDAGYIAARGNLANTLMKTGAFKAALPHFEMALAARPDNVSWRFSYALSLLKINQPQKAFKEFGRIDPGKLPDFQRSALEGIMREMEK